MRRPLPTLAIGLALSIAVLPQIGAAQTATANGQVQKVDAGAGKITLRHGPMKTLDMDEPMTMVYPVKDSSLLAGLKAGDKVKFQAERVNGQLTVTRIEKAK
jgi:Cu/Ag efflux protein CusF